SNVPSNSERDDAGKKNEVKDSAKEGNMNGPGEATNTDNTNRLNIISSPVNTVSSSFTTVDPGRTKDKGMSMKVCLILSYLIWKILMIFKILVYLEVHMMMNM
ncbi:hypothetical protein Tco_1115204, partial [Tanacetum coccineum]